MGQTREVIIYKYVLQNTVEQVSPPPRNSQPVLSTVQNVVTLQEKKRKLARYTLGSRSEESISDAVEVSFPICSTCLGTTAVYFSERGFVLTVYNVRSLRTF